MLGRLGATLGRHRVLVAAAGAAAAAATATALATRTDCLSLVLDDASAATLKKALTEAMAPKKNTAFVFAKPHANTPAVLDVIKAAFAEKGITVLKEGVVTGEEIDSNGYIDQHYYAIAEKSTLTSGKVELSFRLFLATLRVSLTALQVRSSPS